MTHPANEESQIRWVPVKNDSGETIPAFAAMRITGQDSDSKSFTVDKPDTDSQVNVLFNGPCEIPSGLEGVGTHDMPATARYEQADGTPVAGQEWGVEADGWKLRRVKGGYLIAGVLGTGFVSVMRSTTTPGASGETELVDAGVVCVTKQSLTFSTADGYVTDVLLDGVSVLGSGLDVLTGAFNRITTFRVPASYVDSIACEDAAEEDCDCDADCTSAGVSGLNNTGDGFSAGAQDTNWGNAWVTDPPDPGWNSAGSDSQWITLTEDATAAVPDDCTEPPGAGLYEYETTFTVTDLATAKICGRYMADDVVTVLLNGVVVVPEGGGYTDWTSFRFESGFTSGTNTLTFRVNDTQCIVTGLRVEFFT